MVIRGSDGDDRMENPTKYQYFFGGDGEDTVVYQDSGSNHEYSKTDDGGYVVRNHNGEFDLLYDVEHVEFVDEVWDLE